MYFGDNYLTQNFPRALTGQLIHDCGVYALKTAYLLSLISTKLNLKFQYIVLPNHVGLIITGKDIPVFIMHNDDFTILPISEQQFDGLSLTNKHMILNDRGIKAYEDAKKKKQDGPIFTVDKLKDAWVKDTKAKKLKGPVTDEQFIAEEAANLFVPKTDMPFALQEINTKNFNPRLKLAEIKKKMFDEYKRMVRAHELFNPKDPSQFNLRYLSLSVEIKNFNNKILLPYWNGKASSHWQTLTQQLQKLQEADNKKAYIAVLKSYRASFGKEVDDMFGKKYEPINNEKATIHLFIDVKDPDPLNKGARLSVGERGLPNPGKMLSCYI